MLVLSRGPEDRICFPTLGVNVEIIRVDGNRVRVGVDAPREIPVLRHELVDAEGTPVPPKQAKKQNEEKSNKGEHDLRNQLNTAHLALGLVEKQIEAGMTDKAMNTLHRALRSFDQIEERVAPPSDTSPAKRRALLVEDDAGERELLAELLRLSGFDVDTAEDGLQALVYLSRSRAPDVVLMDINMPRLDGAKTIGTIRENPDFAAMQVYAVTGEDPEDVNVSVGPCGVDGWFQKPFQPRELLDHLQNQLGMEAKQPMAI